MLSLAFFVSSEKRNPFILCFQANLEMLGALRERQMKLKKDALCLQEQMTEFRNNVVKEVIAV